VPSVTYHGGPLLGRVEVQAVYYGSDWNSPGLSPQKGLLENYLRYIVNSPYMDMLSSAGYSVGKGSDTPGFTAGYGLNKSQWLTDGQIVGSLQALLNYRYLAPNDANRLYMVFVEPGVAVWAGNHTLGYHTYSGNIRYAVIPYPAGINQTVVRGNVWDSLTVVTSHELAEAVTDPVFSYNSYYRSWYGGWFDSGYPYYGPNQGEIGDLANGYWSRLNGYLVQDVANRYNQVVAPRGATPYYAGYAGMTSPAGVGAFPSVQAVDAALTTDDGIGLPHRRSGRLA
jgi:hypothetical protein